MSDLESEKPKSKVPYNILYVSFAVLNASLGAFFFGYTMGVFNPAQEYIKREVYPHLSSTLLYMMTSVVPAGAAIGALCAGPLSSYLGRRKSMMLTDLISAAATAIQIVRGEVFLLIGRLVCGICVGLNSSLVPLYISEMSPIQVRGTLGIVNIVILTFACALAYALGLFLPDVGEKGNTNWWKIMFAIPVITSLMRFFNLLMVFRSEPPKFYALANKFEEAKPILKKIYKEDHYLEQLNILKNDHNTEANGNSNKYTYRDLVSSRLRGKFAIGCFLSALQQFVGINAIVWYSATIFEKTSNGNLNTSRLQTLIVGILNCVAGALSAGLVNRMGRRLILLSGTVISTIILIVFAVVDHFTHSASQALPYLIFAYTIAFGFSLGPVVWVYLADILPDIGVSIAAVLNWISAFAVGQLFPYMIDWFGQSIAFLVFALFGILGAFFITKFVKETKGLSEKQIEEVFSGTKLVDSSPMTVAKYRLKFQPAMQSSPHSPDVQHTVDTPTQLRDSSIVA